MTSQEGYSRCARDSAQPLANRLKGLSFDEPPSGGSNPSLRDAKKLSNRRAFANVPGGIRTPDRRLRRPLLYPAELLGHNVKISSKNDFITCRVTKQVKNIAFLGLHFFILRFTVL